MNSNDVQLFESKKIRTVWNPEKEEWYFSIVDVIAVLTDSPNPRKYWSVLKTRLKKEGIESTTICSQLKMKSHTDGKYYKTDAADAAQLLRIIQSVPSPKAEPFKLWLAQVGKERVDETIDPELVLNMLAEASTTELSKVHEPKTFDDNVQIAQRGGKVAGDVRRSIESDTKQAVVTPKNAVDFTNLIETVVQKIDSVEKEPLAGENEDQTE